MIFAMKLLWPYLKGHSYAVLNFKAIDPARELHQRQKESIKWKGSRPSQDSDALRDTISRRCISQIQDESVSVCSSYRQSRQDAIEDHKETVMPVTDLEQLDEAGLDGESPHQLPLPSEGTHLALGGQ